MKLSINNDLAEIENVLQKFEKLAESNSISRSSTHKMCIAIDELLSNSIIHGHTDGNCHKIDIHLTIAKNKISVAIQDNGMPFNPLKMADPDTTSILEDRAIGGLGIMLVKTLTDKFEYNRKGNKNQILIEKLDIDPVQPTVKSNS